MQQYKDMNASGILSVFRDFLNENDNSDGHRLAAFLSNNRGGRRPLFADIESEDFECEVDLVPATDTNSISTNLSLNEQPAGCTDLQNANKQIKTGEDVEASEEVLNQQSTHNLRLSPSTRLSRHKSSGGTLKSGTLKSSDRLRRYSLKRLSMTANHGPRTLLSEFENTVNAIDFAPPICSTPTIAQESTKPVPPTSGQDNKDTSPVSSLKSFTNNNTNEIMQSLLRNDEQLKQMLDFESVHGNTIVNGNTASQIGRTYTIEKGNGPNEIVLKLLQSPHKRAEETQIDTQTSKKILTPRRPLTLTPTKIPTPTNTSTGRQTITPTRTPTTNQTLTPARTPTTNRTLTPTRTPTTTRTLTPTRIPKSNRTLTPTRRANSTIQTPLRDVTKIPLQNSNTDNNIYTQRANQSLNGTLLAENTPPRKSSVMTMQSKPCPDIDDIQIPETQDLPAGTQELINSFHRTKTPVVIIPISQVVRVHKEDQKEGQSPQISSPRTPTTDRTAVKRCTPTKDVGVLQSETPRKSRKKITTTELQLNEILTDDETDTSPVSNNIQSNNKTHNNNNSTTSEPLNLAARRNLRKHLSTNKQEEKQKPLPLYTSGMPLNLRQRRQLSDASIPAHIPALNKAPRTPINGEKFAVELKTNLIRMSNRQILDLRKRNSMGKIFPVAAAKSLDDKRKIREQQKALDENIQWELIKRDLNDENISDDAEINITRPRNSHYIPLPPPEFCDMSKHISSNDTEVQIHKRQQQQTPQKEHTIREQQMQTKHQDENDPLQEQRHKEVQTVQHQYQELESQIQQQLTANSEIVASEEAQEQQQQQQVDEPASDIEYLAQYIELANDQSCDRNNFLPTQTSTANQLERQQRRKRKKETPEILRSYLNATKELRRKSKRSNPNITKRSLYTKGQSDTEGDNDISCLSGVIDLPPPPPADFQDVATTSTRKLSLSMAKLSTPSLPRRGSILPPPPTPFNDQRNQQTEVDEEGPISNSSINSVLTVIENNDDGLFKKPAPVKRNSKKNIRNSKDTMKRSASTKTDDELSPPSSTSRERETISGEMENSEVTLRRSKRGHVPLKNNWSMRSTDPTPLSQVMYMSQLLKRLSAAERKNYRSKRQNSYSDVMDSIKDCLSTEPVKKGTRTRNSRVPGVNASTSKQSADEKKANKRSNDANGNKRNIARKNNSKKNNSSHHTSNSEEIHTKSVSEHLTAVIEDVEEATSLVRPMEEPTTVITQPMEVETISVAQTVEKPAIAIAHPIGEVSTAIAQPMEEQTSGIVQPVEKPTTAITQSVEETVTSMVQPVEQKQRKQKAKKHRKHERSKHHSHNSTSGLEHSRLLITTAPVAQINRLFEHHHQQEEKTETESETQPQTSNKTNSNFKRKLRVRVQRIPNQVTPAATKSNKEVDSTKAKKSEAMKTSMPDTNFELIAWLKGISDLDKNIGNEQLFQELRCSTLGNLIFTELDGIDSAFYHDQDKFGLGYLRFRPGQMKPSKRSRAYSLRYVVLAGEFKICTHNETGQFCAGDMIAINKGTRYSIENSGNDVGLLMVFKT